MGDSEPFAAAVGGHSQASGEPREWSVFWMGQSYGPYTHTELWTYAASGQIPMSAQVMRPGMVAWAQLGRVFQVDPAAAPAQVVQPPAASPPLSYAGLATSSLAGFGGVRLPADAVLPFWAAVGAMGLLAMSVFMNYVSFFAGGVASLSFWWGKLALAATIGCGAWLVVAARSSPRIATPIGVTLGLLAFYAVRTAHFIVMLADKSDDEGFGLLVTSQIGAGAGAYIGLLASLGAGVGLAMVLSPRGTGGRRSVAWRKPVIVAAVVGLVLHLAIFYGIDRKPASRPVPAEVRRSVFR